MSTDPSKQPEASTTPDATRRVRRVETGGPFVLGLVGPAGSGKSTVARALAARGARIVSGDDLGHAVTDGDAEVRAALIAEHGPGVYRADATLDRARVAARVFKDPAALARLNRLVHPRILVLMRRAIEDATRAGETGLFVIDAALLLDWGFERECHAVLAVLAPRDLQVARLVSSRGWSEAQAHERLSQVRSNEGFGALADAVIMNDRSEAEAVAEAIRATDAWRAARSAVTP